MEKEIADLKEKTAEIELKWKNEKAILSDIKSIKKQLESLRMEADGAEARADLSKTAEIRYGKIPQMEKDLESKMKRLKTLQAQEEFSKKKLPRRI